MARADAYPGKGLPFAHPILLIGRTFVSLMLIDTWSSAEYSDCTANCWPSLLEPLCFTKPWLPQRLLDVISRSRRA